MYLLLLKIKYGGVYMVGKYGIESFVFKVVYDMMPLVLVKVIGARGWVASKGDYYYCK